MQFGVLVQVLFLVLFWGAVSCAGDGVRAFLQEENMGPRKDRERPAKGLYFEQPPYTKHTITLTRCPLATQEVSQFSHIIECV